MEMGDRRRENLLLMLQSVRAVDLARASNVDETLISRYRNGGKKISEDTARKFERAMKVAPGWMDQQHSSRGSDPAKSVVAHELSQSESDDAPSLKWEDILGTADKAARFWAVLQDDAMAPRAPSGTRVLFDRLIKPGVGDGVLVKDRFGGLHFRLYRKGAGGRWTAAALNEAFEPLDSERDGLEVIAVLCAQEGRWGQPS